jgi:3-oxoacyl-[acyl-carrier-protein] synthase II
MEERIVITGMGAVSPIGLSASESWKNAIEGVSGVGPITLFDASELQVQIACEVKGFIPENYLPAKETRRRDRYQHLAAAAAKEAIQQADLQVSEAEAGRVGVIASSAIGGFKSIQDTVLTLHEQGARKISPFAIPMLMSNGAAGMISIDYGFRGPSFSVASACASAADGLGMAWLMLRVGMIDVALAGGCETTLTNTGIGSFDRLGAMSRRNQPSGNGRNLYNTPAPFDLHRDGLVMGEGAALLVLERESHARARGAEILAELAGYAATADAFHITAPDENGVGSSKAMLQALEAARANPDDVGYINAHGTATHLNDLSETRAIKAAFGNFAYNIPVSSTKSMTGHMMGATGALEAIFCVQAVREDIIPPTINYNTPDPQCDLDYVPNEARSVPVRLAISNAFGFGGHNAVLAIRKV